MESKTLLSPRPTMENSGLEESLIPCLTVVILGCCQVNLCQQKYVNLHLIDLERVHVFKCKISTTECTCSNFYTSRIKKGEIGMMKYSYGAITIMTDDVLILWRGREGILPSLGS